MKKLGVLVAQHPAINHAVILNEIRQLRRHFDVYTASIRAPDRGVDQLTEVERDERSRTYYVKPEGVSGAVRAHAATLALRPGAYLSGLLYALKLGGTHPRRALFHFGYFTQALMVGQWMRRNGLTHLHAHYSSTVGLLVQRVFGVQLSISFHGPDEFADPAGFRIREKVKACTFVRAISQYARSQLMMSSDAADWGKIEVVYMGVDPELFTPRPFRGDTAPVELICVGRLAPVKAQAILIDAVGRVAAHGANLLLHVVGGGPDRAALEALVEQRGLGPHVTFHGFTPQDKLEQLYRRTDIFALASFAEGVPGVLMEAMAMEIPCVATWITGVPELIRNGTDGLLAAASDAEGFAAEIERLIGDPELRLRVGQAGRARVLERFDLVKNSAQLAGVFDRFLTIR